MIIVYVSIRELATVFIIVGAVAIIENISMWIVADTIVVFRWMENTGIGGSSLFKVVNTRAGAAVVIVTRVLGVIFGLTILGDIIIPLLANKIRGKE